jgi:HEAT repeat protein
MKVLGFVTQVLAVITICALLFLFIRHYRWGYQWLRQRFQHWIQAWNGVVIGKYIYTQEKSEIQHFVFELCHGQAIEAHEVRPSTWKRAQIGDYLEKKRWRSAVENRSMLKSEAPQVTSVLADRLLIEDEATRTRAVDALGQIGVPNATITTRLVEILKSDTDQLRSKAASVLGQFGEVTQGTIPALLNALADNAARVRMNAAWALGEMSTPSRSTVAALIKLLKTDQDAKVRFNVVQALKKMGTTEAIKAIQKSPKVEI